MSIVGGDTGFTSQEKSVPNDFEGIAEEKRDSAKGEVDTDLQAIDTAFWRRTAGSCMKPALRHPMKCLSERTSTSGPINCSIFRLDLIAALVVFDLRASRDEDPVGLRRLN